ncbi:uncharacterized protein TEOVI_000562200 [Trypanosoma equiperdum]|uniref:Uncharacterized protein n=1 Tax=Trypanosoma equiperdum TaxID=5694 RepID=A0A1G4I1A6_TRYEQ|nr:hypothetical protein, conserved [Trypanosoma equiperdum]
MIRRLNVLRKTASSCASLTFSTGDNPYIRVLRMLQSDGEGPPAAWHVFEEFRTYYRQVTSGTSIATVDMKPLQSFCGSFDDTEPFAVVMMKILCDLHKLEELRFLFAQCMLELSSPSVELFNVYLLAISLSDTFNQYEVENAIEAMRMKGAEPDVVTKISLFIVYTRLGEDYSSWWPSIHEDTKSIITSGKNWQQKFPLLSIRLQHCFQTLLRVHHDVTMVQECFELLRLADHEKMSPRLLLPYMLLSTNNVASPPSIAVQLIAAAEGASEQEVAEASADIGVNAFEESSSILQEAKGGPVLNNDVTALKLMAKCAKWGDVASADYVLKYLRAHPCIIPPQHKFALALLHLETLVRAGLLKEALYLLEDEIPESDSIPGSRPKLFLETRRLTLLNAHPVMSLVRFIAEVDSRVEESLLLLEERKAAGGNVSHKTLNVVLEACALMKDEQKASLVLFTFRNVAVRETARTFTLLLSTSPNAVSAVKKIPTFLEDMVDLGVEVTAEFLRGGLELAVDAQDVSTAMMLVEYHRQRSVSIESRLSVRLFKMLCLVVDIGSVRQLVAVLRATQSPVDPRCLSLCIASFRKWDIPCDDLKGVSTSGSTG